ncbi:NAD(P)/FAD-dependent oxidoreductase [Georgenia sp. MJ206]|uniref:NAD(P)/FAD-dependent oxidoreductase n=1 Tax=Georgenia wangjunii TaxID=3117730 RepID=UPI002F26540C
MPPAEPAPRRPATAPTDAPSPVPGSGSDAGSTALEDGARVDVVIVGGGPAGLSAALILGRARRSVLVVDSGEPRNAPSPSMHGYLTRDGADPAELRAAGRREAQSYGAQILDAEVAEVRREGEDLVVRMTDDRSVPARRVIVATGLRDHLPAIDGVAERWGRDVLHCPYCHGYEVRDEALGSIAEDPEGAVHQALLLRQWSDDVVLFLNSVAPDELGPPERELLAARGVRVITGPVRAVQVTEDHVSGVELADGEVIPRSAVFVAPKFRVNDALLRPLGVEMEDTDLGRGVVVDDEGRTSAEGVWAVGNLADLAAQVIGATDSGARAAIGINGELCQEDAERALARARAKKQPNA